ncbi:hypothetical protein F8M41_022386 [Gigaspora margarita]|uniref:Uncharacterized protein n=1 Tax=Gigaspora margarita TaxID=4874 RepID=A0A8H4AF52_GIGMA|nr:hypothetical protein F8M41_022386 [Gigaspora margarita]
MAKVKKLFSYLFKNKKNICEASLPCSDSHQKILDCGRLHEEPSSSTEDNFPKTNISSRSSTLSSTNSSGNDSFMSGNSSRTLISSDDGNSDPPSWDILFNKFFMIIQHSLIDVENNHLKLENEFKTQFFETDKIVRYNPNVG